MKANSRLFATMLECMCSVAMALYQLISKIVLRWNVYIRLNEFLCFSLFLTQACHKLSQALKTSENNIDYLAMYVKRQYVRLTQGHSDLCVLALKGKEAHAYCLVHKDDSSAKS